VEDREREELLRRLALIVPDLEKMVETDKRMAWFWSSMRIWGGWVLGILAFVAATKSYLVQIFLSGGK
jgi:hypothetical protein